MIELPAYISITFIITTLLTVGFFLFAVRQTIFNTIPGRLLVVLIAFWLIFQATLAISGFHQVTEVLPPRVFAFGAMPAFLLILIYFLFFRTTFVEQLPLKILTLLHVIRIPVELVLFWLYKEGQIPVEMTFEGRNLDILSGITAPIVYWFAFRNASVNRPLLIVWNVLALLLLVNIVTTAVLAFPSPLQQIALEHPNRGVMYFPFIWLPTIIVPIVLFSHLAALWKLASRKTT